MNSLNAVSPIDGRYRSKCEPLAKYFSEGALIKYRVRVEVEYFIALAERLKAQRPALAGVAAKAEALRDIYRNFADADAQAIKDIEKVTNHDVKAVEYFLKGKFDEMGIADRKEFIHFGLTSQDINNTSVPLSMKECHDEVLLPAYRRIQALLDERAEEWKDIPMLAHTHGQPASPTTLGKEWGVFAYRLRRQIEELERIPFTAKFGGATGNFNAHLAAFPDIDWRAFGNDFVKTHLGLERQQLTTQIENYDMMAAWFDACKRINVILSTQHEPLIIIICLLSNNQQITNMIFFKIREVISKTSNTQLIFRFSVISHPAIRHQVILPTDFYLLILVFSFNLVLIKNNWIGSNWQQETVLMSACCVGVVSRKKATERALRLRYTLNG